MPRTRKSWFVLIAGLLLVGVSFRLASDPSTKMRNKRFRPHWVAVKGDWSAAGPRHGRILTIQSRAPRARLRVPLRRRDAYRLRVFYYLEGEKPARVRMGGKKAGRLAPGGGWRKWVSVVRAGGGPSPLEIAFETPSGGRLTLRRVDYANYLFRIGSSLLVKYEGAARGVGGSGALALTLLGLTALWGGAASLGARRGTSRSPAAASLLGPAALALALLLFPLLSPLSVHARPGFLAAAFLGLACASSAASLLSPSRARRALARLPLVLLGVAIGAVAVEAGLRIWDPPISRPRIRSYSRYSPEYGWRNRAGASGWQVDIGYHIKINRYGHRGPAYPMKKPPGVFRILGLGDSFTFGWGVEEAQTFLRQLERRLRAAGRRVEVINAGVPAWHSSQSLHYLRKEGMRFQPDLVVMSFFTDDVLYSTIEKMRVRNDALQMRAEEEQIRRYRGGPARRFRLYNLWFNYRKLRRDALRYRRRNPYSSFEKERKALKRDFDRNPELVAGLVRMVKNWSRAREELGVPLVFTFIPPGGSLHAPAYQGDARALKRLSAAEGIPYLDLLPVLEGYPNAWALYLHPRDVHMSAAGHFLVGKALADFLLRGGWLKE